MQRSPQWNSEQRGILKANLCCFCHLLSLVSHFLQNLWWNPTPFHAVGVQLAFRPPACRYPSSARGLKVITTDGMQHLVLIFLPIENILFPQFTYSEVCFSNLYWGANRALQGLALPGSYLIRCQFLCHSFCSSHVGPCQFPEFAKPFAARRSLLSARHTVPHLSDAGFFFFYVSVYYNDSERPFLTTVSLSFADTAFCLFET